MFVAPVVVGDGAYTGAGTVLRDDVPPGALAVRRAPSATSRTGSCVNVLVPPPPRRQCSEARRLPGVHRRRDGIANDGMTDTAGGRLS